ncbi:hypothetical protein MG293_002813 [Ovis ammon polii]|nr:hypothetical protein MG293_002813 [Ovis ammon polii]
MLWAGELTARGLQASSVPNEPEAYTNASPWTPGGPPDVSAPSAPDAMRDWSKLSERFWFVMFVLRKTESIFNSSHASHLQPAAQLSHTLSYFLALIHILTQYLVLMDGDSSTTDASQLGISADYIGGSHYVIQPHDDTEDSMNDHEDTNGSKESFREQDIYLPIANVARIMKNAIPQTGKIAKDAKECVQECVSEFISFITSEASERCHQEKRKTINGEDILFAMSTLGFDSYVEPLKLYLQKFREAMKGEKGIGGAVTATDGLSEELTEEAFTNQLPAGLITADGQQQNVMVYTTSYQQISGVQQIQFS